MTKKKWEVTIEGETHNIELDHGLISGKRKINIDGKNHEIPKSELPTGLIDYGSNHKFSISSHNLEIIIKADQTTCTYQLLLDGQLITEDKSIAERDSHSIQEEMNTLRAYILEPLFTLGSICLFVYNLFIAGKTGFYSYDMAIFTPIPIVLASITFCSFPGI